MKDPRQTLEAQLCETRREEPREISNPPGLAALAYRIGEYPDFLRRMLAQLPLETLPDGPHAGTRPLADLATRELDDPAIALLDTWATAADIFTFYQERIANESYLRSAAERRSLLELARLVGQEPGPGVAASALLAFEAEAAPGSPAEVRIPAGTRVLSIPGPGSRPQTFETGQELVARSAWNAMRPRLRRFFDLRGARTLYLAGAATRLAAGDTLLLVVTDPGTGNFLEALTAVLTEVQASGGLTRLRLESALTFTSSAALALATAELFAATQVFALRQRTAFFGHNAPRFGSLPASTSVKADPYPNDAAHNWDSGGRTIWTDSAGTPYSDGSDSQRPVVWLERKIPQIVAGGWVIFRGRPRASSPADLRIAIYRVIGKNEATLADYGASGEATGLALTLPSGDPLPTLPEIDFDVRRTTALVQSEALTLAEEPILEPFPSSGVDAGRSSLVVDRPITGLGSGRLVAVSGERPNGPAGVRESRILVLQGLDPESEPGFTRLLFESRLEAGFFVRDTLRVNANVVLATHGESVREALGSGNGGLANQTFELRSLPLTFRSAPVPGGYQSSLEVRVDGVLWHEVATLHGQSGEARVYTLRVEDDGKTRVGFGNGKNGARLTTGEENVVATYRRGIGLDGNVAADSLQILQTRPLGIRAVTNPLPASGGAPRDGVTELRATAPVRLRTLGRLVSLTDFRDFARAFAGIAKVHSQILSGIHLTVAGHGGAAVLPGTALFGSLSRAIAEDRLPGPPLTLASYEKLPVRLEAQVVVDPRFRSDLVLAAVAAALAAAFSFDRRELAEPLYASQLVPVMQAVPGVVALNLSRFYIAGSLPGFRSVLQARPAHLVGGRAQPAQLLLVESDGITLKVRTP